MELAGVVHTPPICHVAISPATAISTRRLLGVVLLRGLVVVLRLRLLLGVHALLRLVHMACSCRRTDPVLTTRSAAPAASGPSGRPASVARADFRSLVCCSSPVPAAAVASNANGFKRFAGDNNDTSSGVVQGSWLPQFSFAVITQAGAVDQAAGHAARGALLRCGDRGSAARRPRRPSR